MDGLQRDLFDDTIYYYDWHQDYWKLGDYLCDTLAEGDTFKAEGETWFILGRSNISQSFTIRRQADQSLIAYKIMAGNKEMSDIEEIYQGDHVHVDLVDETVEVQIGTNIYSLSEAKEIAAELLSSMFTLKYLGTEAQREQYSNKDQKS
ncbi:MAG: hypothetical protein GY893_10135 [bacterium]|nr:hypothetical protein [bacterium]